MDIKKVTVIIGGKEIGEIEPVVLEHSNIMKYRKKPVEIEAIQFTDDTDRLIELQNFMNAELVISYSDPCKPILKIATLEGIMEASVGDYIIKGIQGEFYPCKPDIFEATYEKSIGGFFFYLFIERDEQIWYQLEAVNMDSYINPGRKCTKNCVNMECQKVWRQQ